MTEKISLEVVRKLFRTYVRKSSESRSQNNKKEKKTKTKKKKEKKKFHDLE